MALPFSAQLRQGRLTPYDADSFCNEFVFHADNIQAILCQFNK